MDSLDPKLFQEYIQQAFEILERKEKVFLEASEEDDPKHIGEIRRLVFLLQKLARAVRRPQLYDYLDGVTQFFAYSEDNWTYLDKVHKEGFLELYDGMANTFKTLASSDEKIIFPQRAEELIISAKATVASKKSSLSFNLGVNKKKANICEYEEIQKLSKDLVVFERGVSSHQMEDDSRNHLKAIANRLSNLADKINLLSVNYLFESLNQKFAPKGFRFGLYGGQNEADRRVVLALEESFSQVLEQAFFSTDEERPEVYLKAIEIKGCLKVEAQLNRVKLAQETLALFEGRLESLGFQTHFSIDESSGTCIEALAPKTLNTIEGQVIESWGSLLALDMRFVKACIKVRKEAFFRRKDGQFYLNSEYGQLPVVELGQSRQRPEEVPLDVVVLETGGFKVAIPAQKIHRRQSLSLRGPMNEVPLNKYYKSVCLLENSKPGLLLNAKAILKDFKKAELEYAKYIEIKYPEHITLVNGKDLLEIAPYEKVTKLPTADGETAAMINYGGEPIIVYSLEEKLGLRSDGDFRHILICKDTKGVFGLAVGADIKVARKLKEDVYSEPAFSVSLPKSLIKEVFHEEGREQLVLEVEKLRDFSSKMPPLKKVA